MKKVASCEWLGDLEGAHSLREKRVFLGPTNSQSIAVKEFWFSRVEFEVVMCGGVCVNFFVANFPGN